MKYTLLGSRVDNKLQSYVEIIVEEITKSIPETLSIILGGGFGKEEGSVEVIGDKIIPINDFDIFIITKKRVPDKLLNDIANKATERLDLKNKGLEFYKFDRKKYADTFYLDLKTIPISRLKYLPPMIRYYELKNASSIVYGQDYRYLIPDYDIKDIPLAEGFRFLLNRMALLVTYFSTDFIKGKITPGEYKGLKYLACSKAFLACCEGLLMLNRKFVPTYRGRTETFKRCYKKDFPELYKKLPKLAEKVEQATNFKLKSKFTKQEDPFEIWHDAAHCIGEVTKYFVEKWIGIEINNYHQLSQVIYRKVWPVYFGPYAQWYLKHRTGINFGMYLPAILANKYMTWSYYTRLKNFRNINHKEILKNPIGPDITLYAVLPELLYSILPDKTINLSMLIRAGRLNNKAFPTNQTEMEDRYKMWDCIAKQFAEAYIIFCFLKIV